MTGDEQLQFLAAALRSASGSRVHTIVQLRVLVAVYHSRTPPRPKDLNLSVPKSMVSRSVTVLEERGLLRRRQWDQNARSVILEQTEKGRRLFRAIGAERRPAPASRDTAALSPLQAGETDR